MSGLPIKHSLLRATLLACGLAIAPGLLFPVGAMAAAKCKPSDITQSEAGQLAMLAAQPLAPYIVLFPELEEPADPRSGEALNPAALATIDLRVFDPYPKPGVVSNTIGWYSVGKRTAALSDALSQKPVVPTPAVKAEQARLRKVHCLG